MNKNPVSQEMVSALVDGELEGADFARTVDWVCADQEARASWAAYHVVGDTLRSSELARCAVKRDFMARLQARLQDETLPRPQALPQPVVAPPQHLVQKEAANASVFRWKMVAGLASVAAVTALSWNLWGQLGGDSAPTVASATPEPVVPVRALSSTAVADAAPVSPAPLPAQPLAQAAAQPGEMVMIRDPHLDALLAAHKQFGGTSALQGPAGFLRNATFEQR